jgi:hypothetical protein
MPGNWPVPFGKGPSEKDPSHGHLVGGLLHLMRRGLETEHHAPAPVPDPTPAALTHLGLISAVTTLLVRLDREHPGPTRLERRGRTRDSRAAMQVRPADARARCRCRANSSGYLQVRGGIAGL